MIIFGSFPKIQIQFYTMIDLYFDKCCGLFGLQANNIS